MEWEDVHRADVVRLLSDLVAIESVNPSLVPGGGGEGPIADFVAGWMSDSGLEVEVVEVAPGRPNVIGRVPGRSNGRSLLLNAHLDTVGVAGMDRPFESRVEGDRLYGRGAFDMKGGLAAIMLAGRAIARAGGTDGDLIVTAVMDEEYASLGTQDLLRSLRVDAAVVTEPTSLRLCLAHKGFAWLRVETEGRAAHGSKPELGIDAIAHMGRVLVEVEALGHGLARGPSHPLLGTGSIHASLIEGGQELSSYPERCRLQLERRTIPGESPDDVLGAMESHLAGLRASDAGFSAAYELFFWRDPFEVSPREPVVRTLARAALEVTGCEPAVYGDTPWMDAALFSAAGIPTVVFGPGGAGAHAAREYVLLQDVELCARTLARLAVDFSATVESSGKGDER